MTDELDKLSAIFPKIAVFTLAIFTLLIITKTVNVFAQSTKEVDTQKIDSFLSNTVTSNQIPGLAMIVVQNGQVVFKKGYKVTPQTQFYIGSVSKSFTALAIMQLAEQGKIDLDNPIQSYLPWFEIADKNASQKITVRNLLNHTSGLSEAGDPGASKYSPTLKEQIEQMKTAKLTAPIGTKYQYDSQNYRVLALLVEQVSGQTFSDYLKDNIFIPLSMDNSTADPQKMNSLVQGYGQMFGFPIAREEKFQPAGLGSGYIVSTAEDMGKYLTMMLNHGKFNSKNLITEKSWTTMITPPEGVKSEYGMGWMVVTMNNEKTIYHGGSLTNYHAFAMMLPEKNTGFVFLSNQNGIIPMLTVFNALKKDMAKFLADNTLPSGVSYSWVFWLLRILALATIVLQVYRIVRLPKWIKSINENKLWRRWLNAFLNLLIPLAFLGIPFFAKTFLGASSASWRDAYSMLPDVVFWLMTILFLNLSIGVAKSFALLKDHAKKFEHPSASILKKALD